MIILSIETSCDETAISIVEVVGEFPQAKYEILGNSLFSQIDIHREYGGVFPALAKREHIVTIVPMLERALAEANLPAADFTPALDPAQTEALQTMLSREPGLADQLLTLHKEHDRPPIDLIAVTSGPGLAPALWVGLNFAKALATLWNIPAVPVDHMEGHILASVFDGHQLGEVKFPALSLLVSGGHTELILMTDWGKYEKVGQTRDDAVGEAFDKVARMLGLPYPGGPEISRAAKEARERNLPPYADLPAPMLKSGDLDFSFSGLKTAVRIKLQDQTLTHDEVCALARDFEDVVVKVLLSKLETAIETYAAESVILGGGVAANTTLRSAITDLKSPQRFPDLAIYLPEIALSTDNSVMIALAGHARSKEALAPAVFAASTVADSNRSL